MAESRITSAYVISEQVKFDKFVIYRGIHYTVWYIGNSVRKNMDCMVMWIYFKFDLK